MSLSLEEAEYRIALSVGQSMRWLLRRRQRVITCFGCCSVGRFVVCSVGRIVAFSGEKSRCCFTAVMQSYKTQFSDAQGMDDTLRRRAILRDYANETTQVSWH
jgi:uncharacterized metal-binding protein